ncbi:unnamed protein product, partial [Prorocentrum cordatum]
GTTLDFDDDFNDDIPDEWSVKNPARCPYYHLAPKTTMEGRAVEQTLFSHGEEDEYDPRNPCFVQPADTQQVVESTARQLQQQIARLQSLIKAREKIEPTSSTAMKTYKRVLEELRADFADLGVELEPVEEGRGGGDGTAILPWTSSRRCMPHQLGRGTPRCRTGRPPGKRVWLCSQAWPRAARFSSSFVLLLRFLLALS